MNATMFKAGEGASFIYHGSLRGGIVLDVYENRVRLQHSNPDGTVYYRMYSYEKMLRVA